MEELSPLSPLPISVETLSIYVNIWFLPQRHRISVYPEAQILTVSLISKSRPMFSELLTLGILKTKFGNACLHIALDWKISDCFSGCTCILPARSIQHSLSRKGSKYFRTIFCTKFYHSKNTRNHAPETRRRTQSALQLPHQVVADGQHTARGPAEPRKTVPILASKQPSKLPFVYPESARRPAESREALERK